MDSNASSYILNHAEYYLSKEDSNIIDLGLSLRTLQPDQACYPSPHENYELLVEWHHRFKRTTNLNPQIVKQSRDGEESEGIQSKQRWASYVKVNMDGVIVGRKICILDSVDYSSLALRLEEMFGKQSSSGLRLFEAESQFSLVYKDTNGKWRNVGDVLWM
ncbi:auxin-responsive protein [Striga asiatica]|uniref:Auxin-responsive protein n=1 Tax=Striga asiatica TaxID=4170 RepID=A0A5A7QNX4_STRAF|nr:auxin-responsive protein [Striga asiatica]